jgi:hypothetical protein
MGAIVAAQLTDPPSVDSFMRGFERSLLVAAGIALAGALVAAWLIRPHDTTQSAEERQPLQAEAL